MQRVIKFRGRVRKTGEWVYGSLELYSYGAGPGTAIIHTFLDWGLNGSVQVDPKTVGQFTGLKDKNGVEIYEGDIVKYQASLIPLVEELYVCIWYQNGFGYKKPGEDDQASMYLQQSKLEVIGNIHEKPDLLSNPQ